MKLAFKDAVLVAMLLLQLMVVASSSAAPHPTAAQAAAASQPGPSVVTVEIACNQDVLRTYLLKGRQKSTASEPFILCPQVTNNCCLKSDQQRIYHIVNDILPARLSEYNSKVKMALARIKKFHKRVIAVSPEIIGSARRRKFCLRQVRNVMNFPFNGMYQSMIEMLEEMNEEMHTYHQSFLCILCDGTNHPFFEFGGMSKKVIFDVNFCKEMLGTKATIIRALNVELIDYLIALQNLVDCTHYVKSYNLPFFDQEKVKNKAEVTNCLNYMGSRSFLRNCRPMCEKLTVSKISTQIQGDFEFMIDAANLFEKFYDFKETGNFISTKLKKFFKRFVVASPGHKQRRLKPKSGSLVPSKLVKSSKRENRKLVKIWTQREKDRKAVKKELKLTKKERKLRSMEAEVKVGDLSALPSIKDAPELKNDAPVATAVPSALVTENTQGMSLDAGEDQKLPGRVLEKQPVRAKVDINPTLASFYNLIIIQQRADLKSTSNIYEVQGEPLDFEKPIKTWSVGNGINPYKYAQNQFNITSHRFYRMLYNLPKREQNDVKLEFFLADFTKESLENSLVEIKNVFKMDPKQFVLEPGAQPKDQKPAGRLLEQPGRVKP